MRAPLRTRFVVLIVAVALLAIPVGGVAFAYWSGAASGSGTGGTGDLAAVSISPSTPTGSLYPGGQSDIAISVSNPNDEVVHLSTISLNGAQGTGGFAVDAGHSGCDVSTLTFTTQSNAGTGWDVPARVGLVDGTLDITLTSALAMGSAANSACQGATFTVYLGTA
jgi:hypothetical protein